MTAIIGYTGRVFISGTHAFLAACSLIVDTLFWLAIAPLRGRGLRVRASVEQFVRVGYDSLPIVMLMGYRGYQTLEPGAARLDTAASFFEPTLKAWDIPYTLLREDGEVGQQIASAFRTASERSRPTAVLIVGTTT